MNLNSTKFAPNSLIRGNLHLISLTSIRFFSDSITIFIAAYLSFRSTFKLSNSGQPTNSALGNIPYDQLLLYIAIGWIITLCISESYKIKHTTVFYLDPFKVVRPSVNYFLALGFLSFMTKASFSRSIFVYLISFGITMLVLSRIILHFLIVYPLVTRKKIFTRLMLIGSNQKELDIYSDWIINNPKLGYKVVNRSECKIIDFDWLESFDKKLQISKAEEVLLLPGMERDHNYGKFLNYLEDLNLHVNWVPLNSGNFGYWQIPQSQEGSPFLTFKNSKLSVWKRILKRIFDITFSILVLAFILPLLLTIAIIILLRDGKPVFFLQKRIGKDGKSFNFIKFRTMITDVSNLERHLVNSLGVDHVLFKDKEDPRITKTGKILRRFSLDELPQFINVILNNMSVVGPRPALPREVSVYSSTYERRLIAKPGITGPWQIGGRSDLDLQASVALDLNYVTNWSFTKDLWIIIKTITAVVNGRGAY
ncbi:undecaprenyl-phosphate galactose phosphotransferase [Candidatus Nanopelagicaceae bacterium]